MAWVFGGKHFGQYTHEHWFDDEYGPEFETPDKKRETKMIRVVAKNFIKPEKIKEAEPLFRELVAETQKEEGCVEYRLFVAPGQPGLYCILRNGKAGPLLTGTQARRIIPGSFPGQGQWPKSRVKS
jgi:hypothetical protein